MTYKDNASNTDTNQSLVYLSLLGKSLEKKAHLLSELTELTHEQEELISKDQLEDDRFISIINQKGELIKQVNELDNGFELLYQRVREELKVNPGSYKEHVERLKTLVTDVTDKGVQLQAMERRNKDKIDLFLHTRRKNIKSFKMNQKTASSYYSNTGNKTTDSSYFFDKKK